MFLQNSSLLRGKWHAEEQIQQVSIVNAISRVRSGMSSLSKIFHISGTVQQNWMLVIMIQRRSKVFNSKKSLQSFSIYIVRKWNLKICPTNGIQSKFKWILTVFKVLLCARHTLGDGDIRIRQTEFSLSAYSRAGDTITTDSQQNPDFLLKRKTNYRNKIKCNCKPDKALWKNKWKLKTKMVLGCLLWPGESKASWDREATEAETWRARGAGGEEKGAGRPAVHSPPAGRALARSHKKSQLCFTASGGSRAGDQLRGWISRRWWAVHGTDSPAQLCVKLHSRASPPYKLQCFFLLKINFFKSLEKNWTEERDTCIQTKNRQVYLLTKRNPDN